MTAIPTAQRVGAVFGDLDRDRRQLRDLVAVRLVDRLPFTVTEITAAARAALGPVLDDLIQL